MGERDHYLHGADDVRSAANTMRSAADTMTSAASSMHEAANRIRDALYESQIAIGQFVERFEAAVAKMETPEIILGGDLIHGDTHVAEFDSRPARPGHKDICTADRCHCGSQ